MKQIILLTLFISILSAQSKQEELPAKIPNSRADTVMIEQPKPPKNHDYRYQIVGGVTMMLFFGLALGLTQTNNPQ